MGAAVFAGFVIGFVLAVLAVVIAFSSLRKDIDTLLAYEARSKDDGKRVLERLRSLASREDVAEAVKRLEARLKEAPETLSRDDEIRLSKSMEEGMSNLLQYAAGRAPGVEVRL